MTGNSAGCCALVRPHLARRHIPSPSAALAIASRKLLCWALAITARLHLLALRRSDQSSARPESSQRCLASLSALTASATSLVHHGTEKLEGLAQGTAMLTSPWVNSTR